MLAVHMGIVVRAMGWPFIKSPVVKGNSSNVVFFLIRRMYLRIIMYGDLTADNGFRGYLVQHIRMKEV